MSEMKQLALTHLGSTRVYEFLVSQTDTAWVPCLVYLISLPSHLRGPVIWRMSYRSKMCGAVHQRRRLRGQRSSQNTPLPQAVGRPCPAPWGTDTRALWEDEHTVGTDGPSMSSLIECKSAIPASHDTRTTSSPVPVLPQH